MNPHFWKDRTVLLTGHTGFKGSWLSLWLQLIGTKLIGYSKSVPTEPSLFEVANVQNGMTSIVGDIGDLDHLKDVIRQYSPEIIIHMAAQSLVHRSYEDPIETYSTNVMGTVNLLEAVRTEGKAKVVINVTSDKCYENRELGRSHQEDDPMGGYDPYSSSKGCAELITSSFRNSFFNSSEYSRHGLALASVRAGNVIGGGDWAKDRLIPDIMNGIVEHRLIKIRHPSAVRPWQYVLEPLRGYLMLAEKLWNSGPEYVGGWNFGPVEKDIKPVSWIVGKISDYWNGGVRYEFNSEGYGYESDYLKLDCSKVRDKLQWLPKINLSQALQLTTEWYKQYERKHDMRAFTEEQIKKYSLL